MDVTIEKLISDTSTTTTSAATAGRTRNFIKKKRKLYLNKMCDMLRSKNETMGNSDLESRATTPQMSNLTATHDVVVVVQNHAAAADSTRVCLICRQHIKECCVRCCQHLQATTTTKATETSTDNNSRFSLINKNRQTVDNYNSNNNNISNNYSYRSHSKNLMTTTTITTTTTCNSSCLPQNSSCAASSTSKSALATSSPSPPPPPTTKLCCHCNVCSCKSSSTKAATFLPCHCQSSEILSPIITTTRTTRTAPTFSSLSSLSPPATNITELPQRPTHLHDSGTNVKNHGTTTIRASTTTSAAATFETATSPNRSSSFAVSLFRNGLRTFQFLIFFIQMHFMQTIYNNQLYNNYYNNNNKRQQQCPPLPRLKFRRNSYCYNATNINLNNASHKQQASTTIAPYKQQQQQLKHHQQHQHNQRLHRIQVPSQHFRYCKMPNLSPLYMILIVLSFLSLFLPSTHATQTSLAPMTSSTSTSITTQVRLTRSETVCKSMDIRNTPDAFSQLENCTVIEGFLLMTLVNTHTQKEFTETYPLLTEVTEFIIVYRVHNLRSLSQIFPNLSVIRGRALHDGYALVVYSNPHLEDLGLYKLTISRGGVRIQDNIMLCFVETIDWTRVVANATDNVIMQNRAEMECPKCPGDAKPSDETSNASGEKNPEPCMEYHGRRHCWSAKTCQKICPERCRDNCIDQYTCCNEACVGGCSPTNSNECLSCRHYSIYNNTCTAKCPENYYSYLDRRCLTSETCARIGTKYEVDKQETLVPYDGVCTTRCPDGYTKVDAKCQKCHGKCVQHCHGGLIDSVARAKQFHGCTNIGREGLVISIKRGGRHLMEELEFGLSSIEVIDTYLKVHRTIGMFSLEFFKNLKHIKGTKLCEDKFALYVLENNDLETLWKPKQEVRIDEGRVFFHFNPKLCYSAIDALRPMLRNNATFDKNEVATDSNGYKGSCNTEFLNATVISTSSVIAYVKINNPLKFEDERTFIGYQYFVIEDEYRNQTKHGHRPCDDGWTASEPIKDNVHIFTGLAPFKQYAFYVKTMTISSEPRNAQSPIKYFKTKSAEPSYVRMVTGYANSSSEIIVSWERPALSHGNLTKYKVHVKLLNDTNKSDSRNYCKDPLKEAAKTDVNVIKPSTEKPEVATECKCRKESSYDDDNDVSIHGNIEFENSVQNFVYVKNSKESRNTSKTPEKDDSSNESEDSNKKRFRRSREIVGDSFLFRHMRALPDEKLVIEDGLLSTTTSISTVTPSSMVETSSVQDNDTRWNSTGEYYELFFDSVNASTKSYTFKKLKHFSTYSLGVEACREHEVNATEKECSRVQTIFVRTLGLENVDKVEHLHTSLDTTNSSIRVYWDPPTRPNGAVVSYTISYTSAAADAVAEKRCVTAHEYLKLNGMGYPLVSLSTGTYGIRVRANTLAGEGIYSKIVYENIPPTKMSSTIIIVIIFVVILVLTIIIGVCIYIRKNKPPPSDLKIFPTVNPFYISLQYIPDDWEVPRERVLQLSPLGQGSFGMVYEGILKNYDSSADDTPCAIKTVNENATDRERMNFLNEASVMKQFDTYHVVRLLGVCSRGQPALVVMELMKNGDLKSYLRAHRPDERDEVHGNLSIMMAAKGIGGGGLSQPPPLSRIYQMAIEIADGMAYLAAKKFVHRDLAARNCMVALDLTVKIGDFGMTRDIYETDYYRKGTKGLLPVRWMPPESLRDGVYSSASDVFSYGVVLWEMATLASQPYQGLSNDQVLRYVIDGGVMERPELCPDKLYCLMQKCWHHRPTARPSFMQIIRDLMDTADPNFQEVSFYHSDEGQTVLKKDAKEHEKRSGYDPDEMDDATTPAGSEYELSKVIISSVDNSGGDFPIAIDDEHPDSPFSASIINPHSTPDGLAQSVFPFSNTPSTSADAVCAHLPAPPSNQRTHHQISQPYFARYPRNDGDEAAYVQPDYGEDEPTTTMRATARNSITTGGGGGKSVETDDRGYELYDPSPNYREQAPYEAADDEDEEEEDFTNASQNQIDSYYNHGARKLLPRSRGGARMAPTIMPMSHSMPDEPTSISAPTMSSSLHPSTASAASSNASSTTTTTGGGGSKIPSLKRAVADTVQSMPARLRNINRRIFSNHKRSGSTASHGSTIESGGSGSAGSYVAAPRFFTPSGGPISGTTSTSDNPNYKLLDESTASAASPPRRTRETPAAVSAVQSSENPNYVMMAHEPEEAVASPPTHFSENPNYEMMGAPPGNVAAATMQPFSTLSAALRREQSREQFHNSATSSSTSADDDDQDDDEDDEHTEHIKMERMPLSRPKSSSSRSRSQSRTRSGGGDESKVGTPSATPSTTGQGGKDAKPTSTFSLKEKWLRQQQQQQQAQQAPKPPPNGFIEREK